MAADIERLATELAALSPHDRELVLQRMQVIGSRAREIGQRLRRGDGTFIWADLIGEHLYDTYGVAIAVVKNIKLKTQNNDDVDRFDALQHERRMHVGHTVVEIISYGITRSDM